MNRYVWLFRALVLGLFVAAADGASFGQGLSEIFDDPAPPPVKAAQRPVNNIQAGGGNAASDPRHFGRIINGKPTAKGSYPAMVVLVFLGSNKGEYFPFCGGTVIAPEWVLTAGHCIVSMESNRAVLASSIAVKEGTKTLDGGRVLPVREVIPHPQYYMHREGGLLHAFSDVALLHLAEPSKQIPQTLLSAAMRTATVQDGAPATVVGFGKTVGEADADMSPILQQASVPIVGRERCEEQWPDLIYRHNICIGGRQGAQTSCQGDSGGPLFMRGPDGGPVQVGITSWGPANCDPARYSVFTSVADFESFVRGFVPDANFADPTATGGVIGAAAGAGQGDQPMEDAPQVALDVQPSGNIHAGTKLQIRVESSVPGTLVVVNIDAAGQVTQLYPNRIAGRRLSARANEGQIEPGQPVLIPAPGDRFALTAGPPFGENRIIATVTPAGSRISALLAENDGMQTIANGERYLGRLAQIVAEPSPQAPDDAFMRHIDLTATSAASPVAERRFRIEP